MSNNRRYPRDEIRWDINDLQELAKLDPPQATYFEKADRWVVKFDGRSFGVKPEQIVDRQQETGETEKVIPFDEARRQAEADSAAEHAYNRGRTPAQVENAAYERAVTPPGSLDAQLDDLLAHFTTKGK